MPRIGNPISKKKYNNSAELAADLGDETGSGLAVFATSPTITSPIISATWDGWVAVTDAWSYASATTITVPSGAASKYQKGDKIKLTQTTPKYFHVTVVADTLLTVTGGSDYTVANAAISAISYSKVENPQGFPQWFNWTATITGFSANPTSLTHRFKISGNVCCIVISHQTAGTSNATSYTVTLPVAASASIGATIGYLAGQDAGTLVACDWVITASDTTIAFRKGLSSTGWTNSGTKRGWCEAFYEI